MLICSMAYKKKKKRGIKQGTSMSVLEKMKTPNWKRGLILHPSWLKLP